MLGVSLRASRQAFVLLALKAVDRLVPVLLGQRLKDCAINPLGAGLLLSEGLPVGKVLVDECSE